VSQRTFKIWFFKEPYLAPQRTVQSRVLQRTISLNSFFKDPVNVSQRTFEKWSLRQHFWFHKEPFKPGFYKEPFP